MFLSVRWCLLLGQNAVCCGVHQTMHDHDIVKDVLRDTLLCTWHLFACAFFLAAAINTFLPTVAIHRSLPWQLDGRLTQGGSESDSWILPKFLDVHKCCKLTLRWPYDESFFLGQAQRFIPNILCTIFPLQGLGTVPGGVWWCAVFVALGGWRDVLRYFCHCVFRAFAAVCVFLILCVLFDWKMECFTLRICRVQHYRFLWAVTLRDFGSRWASCSGTYKLDQRKLSWETSDIRTRSHR